MDFEGIKALLRGADRRFPRLSHMWVDAGYRGEDKGAAWVKKIMGWSVELVDCASGEALVYAAMIRLMTRRITRV